MADVKNEAMDEFFDGDAPEPEILEDEAPAEESAPEEEASAEETPLEAAETEPAEEPPAEAPADERPPKSVPIQALDEERQKRYELERKVETMNDRFSEVLTRLSQPPAPPPAEVPAFEDDPAGHLKHQVDELNQVKRTVEQEREYSNQVGQANNAIIAAEQAYGQTQPDYIQAVQHVAGIMFKNAQIYGSDPAAAMASVRQEMFDGAVKALAAGRDPAATLYERAKLMGYSTPATSEGTPKPSLEKQATQLRAVEQGQKVNRSLSEAGGQAQPDMSLEALASMDAEDFDKNWDKIVGAAARGRGTGLAGIFNKG